MDAFAAQNGLPAFGKDLDQAIKYRDEHGAYRAVRDTTDSVLSGKVPKPGSKTGKLSATGQAKMDTRKQAVVDQVNALVSRENWKASPDVEVIGHLDDIENPEIRAQAYAEGANDGDTLGFKGSDGVVRLFANNLRSADEVTGIMYHESLAHYGLSRRFGEGLTDLMGRIYENDIGGIRERADDWKNNNPKVYKGDPNRDALAVEEVLAIDSERGHRYPTALNRVTNYVKNVGRDMGIDLKYSKREVDTILGMAHRAVRDGKGISHDVTDNGFKMARVWHGSGADFDKFDHSYMSSGEGNQAYGWGTYLAEERKTAESYRNIIGGSDLSWNGLKGDAYTTRRRMEADVNSRFPDDPMASRVAGDIYSDFTQEGRLPPLDTFVDDTARFKPVYDYLQEKLKSEPKGRLYEAEIPDQAHWLNWDKPISEQPSIVESIEGAGYNFVPYEKWNAIQRRHYDLRTKFNDLKSKLDDLNSKIDTHEKGQFLTPEARAYSSNHYPEWNKEADDLFPKYQQAMIDLRKSREEVNKHPLNTSMTGEHVYDTLSKLLGGQKEASTFLREAGIHGNKYLDGLSRKAGKGTHNYVSFDDKTPKIVNKFSRRAYASNDFRTPGEDMAVQDAIDKAAEFWDISNIEKALKERDFRAEVRTELAKAGYDHDLIDKPTRDGVKNPIKAVNDDSINLAEHQINEEKSAKRVAFNRYAKRDDREIGAYDPGDLLFLAPKEALDALKEGYVPIHRSWSEAKAAMRERGFTAKQISQLKRGVGDIDVKLFEYDVTAKRTQNIIAGVTKKMEEEGVTAENKANYLKAITEYTGMLGRILGDQAQVGRALNAMKALQHTKRNITALNEILADQGGNLAAFGDDKNFLLFAKRVDDMMRNGNTRGAMSMVGSVAKPYWWQYVLTGRHAMMLSGLGTHAKNITDNVTIIAREMEEAAMSVPLHYARKALRTDKEGVGISEIAGRTYGLLRALADVKTYRDTWDAAKHGHSNNHVGSKVEMGQAKIPVLSKVGDILHAQDTFFRAFMNNINLYALGVREAKARGIKGFDSFQEGANIAYSPSEAMLKEAKDMADMSLLVDRPAFATLEALKAIRPGMNAGQQLAAFSANIMLPFFRVSDRLIMQKLRRSPLSFLDRNTREDFMAGGARRDIAIMRTIYGSALIGYYWYQASKGKTEGNVKTYQKQQALEPGGYLPNSVDENGKQVDISALNLSANPLDLHTKTAADVASIYQAWKGGTDTSQDTATRLAMAAHAMFTTLASDSFANNLQPYAEALQQGQTESSSVAAMGSFAGGIGSSFLPAGLRQYNTEVHDPIKRDTTTDKTISGRIYGRMASGVPGLSSDLPIKYNAYGQEQEQGKTPFGMRNFQPHSTDTTVQELQRLEKTTDSVVVPPVKSFKMPIGPDGKMENITGERLSTYQKTVGWYFMNEMKAQIEDSEWKDMTDEERIDRIKKVHSQSVKDAKDYLGVPDANDN